MTIVNHINEQSGIQNATVVGDKLTVTFSEKAKIKRWGFLAVALVDVGAGMVAALDIIPKNGGTRVNGSVSGGLDTAGGTISTGATDVSAGTGLYHEPIISQALGGGTGVNQDGGQLVVLPGDTAVIEVTDAADTAGASVIYWIEYEVSSFSLGRDDKGEAGATGAYTKKVS